MVLRPRTAARGVISTLALAVVIALLPAAAGNATDRAPAAGESWYFHDTGTLGWGQTITPPYWEWMDGTMPTTHGLVYYDLDPVNPYYASTQSLTVNYSGQHFVAEIWLANSYTGHSNPVTVNLRRGNWGTPGTLVASAAAMITNDMSTPLMYTFDFGPVSGLNLNQEALVVEIVYSGQQNDAHVYWDEAQHPSRLTNLGPIPTLTEWGLILLALLLLGTAVFVIRRTRASAA